jgi:hypothetical protein
MNQMPISVLTFTAGDEDRKEGYSKFVEYVKAFEKKEDTVGNVSFAEADAKMLDFVKEEIFYMTGKKTENFRRIEDYCNNTDVKEAFFAIVGMLTDLVMPDALIKDISAIATIKNVGWGESLKIDMQPRDLFVVSKGGRGKRSFDIKRQFKGTATIIPEPRDISVGISLYDILRGAYNLAELVMKAVLSLEVQVKYDVYDALSTAMNALSTTGDTKLKVAGYSQSDAIGLAQKVTAWNGGRKAIFLGTKLALSTILPASTNYRFDLGSEYVKMGHLRDFFGFDVVELEQIADYTTEFKVKLSDTQIYVVSPGADKIIKVLFEGSTMSNVHGNYDKANLIVNGDLSKSWGVGAYTSAIGGLITVTLP